MKKHWTKLAGSGAMLSGAVGATLFASCCAIPLALGVIGLGSSGAAFFAAEYRLPLLIASVVAFGVGVGVWLRSSPGASAATGEGDGCARDTCGENTVKRGRALFSGLALLSALLFGFSLGKLDTTPSVASAPEPTRVEPLPGQGPSGGKALALGTDQPDQAGMLHVEIPVTKMSCAPCAAPIKAALEERFNVQDWAVDIAGQRVAFSVAHEVWSADDAVAIVKSLGFKANAPDVRESL